MNIFLAGCDSLHFSKLAVRAGAKNLLFSYYHATGKQTPEKLQDAFDYWNRSQASNVICDSGLFTMMFGVGKDKKYTPEDLKAYTKKYISTAQSWDIKNLTIVECDVHKILGMKEVFEFRKRFEDSGLKVLYVWHVEEGLDGLYKMAEKYDFIALSVPELRKVFKGKDTRYQDAIFDLLSKIKRNCSKLPKIHLLGNTIRETMETRIAWSCDSTSWLSSGRYGQGDVFRNGRFDKLSVRSPLWKELLAQSWDEDFKFIRETLTGTANADYLIGFITMARQYMKYQQWLNCNYQWEGTDGH